MDLIPWTDRQGRFSALRAAVFALLLAPALWILWRALTDGLGPEPRNQAMHESGRWALRFLALALAVTPIGRILGEPRILALRRMVGLGALAWAAGHLVLYAALQNGNLVMVLSEIVQRIYLAIGTLALLGLVWLGWTSTDAAMKRLGRGWKRLHRLVFPVTALALLHAFIQSKADISPSVFHAGLILGLLLWRLLPAARQRSLPVLAALVVAATLAAAALEWAWYAALTALPAGRVWAANWDWRGAWDFGPRPAVQAGLWLAGFVLLAAGWRLAGRGRRA